MNGNYYQQPAAPGQGSVPPPGYVPPRPAYAPKIKHPPIAGNGMDAVMLVVGLIFSVFAVHAVFFAGFFKLGFCVAYVIWFVLENIYIFSKNKPHFSLYAVVLGVLSLGASGVFALFNDELINTALLICIAFCNALYFLLLTKQNRFPAGELGSVLDAARCVIVMPFAYFTEPFRSAFSGQKNAVNGKAKPKGKTGQILLGILISVPIVAILITLLSNADAAFKGLVGKLFSNLLLSFVKLLLGIILFPLLLAPAFALRYNLPGRDSRPVQKKDRHTFPSAISITVLTSVSLIYLVYLFAQLAYFFSAFRGILPENYSASEYARKGFFEMCTICALNALFIALSMAFAKRDSKAGIALHKLFQSFIALVSLVIAASSFSKMYLYIQLYGLTKKRVLTSIFIAMLCVVFIALIIRIFAEKFPYFKMIAVCCIAMLIAVGYADIDSRIAAYNYKLYQNNSAIVAYLEDDGGFIEELGDSAAPAIADFAANGRGEVQKQAQAWLCEFWGRENIDGYYAIKLSKSDTLLSYNKARRQATEIAEKWNERYHYDTFFTYYAVKEDIYDKIFADQYSDIYTYAFSKMPSDCQDYCYHYESK
ncbi:MAG: DUF4173 domain-containing protein [Ruminococcaceae bacterium]|nr:DUF4173 domain-containing protein [Oscillospiraceae bacterium]